MHKLIRIRLGVLIPLFVILSLAVFGVVYASHSWGAYHWARSTNPFTLKAVDSVTSAWDSYLDTANVDWSVSNMLDLTKEAGSTGSTDRRRCKPVAGKIRACNYTYGNNGWLGLAQIWVSGNHITQGVTKVNDTYFNTTTYNTPAWRSLVMCQEVGHTFGLDHQDENFSNPNLGTCMDYTSNPAGPPGNEHPNLHDYDQLETIYAHLESSTSTVTRGSSSANNDDVDGPRQWGRIIKKSSDGHPSLYVRDFGGGHKVFTFVIWAE